MTICARDQRHLDPFGEPVKIMPAKPSIRCDIWQLTMMDWFAEYPESSHLDMGPGSGGVPESVSSWLDKTLI